MALPVVECKFVTEDRIQEWKSSAIPDILQVEVPPTRFVYELCWTLIRGDLPFSKCRAAMNSVEFAETPIKEEMASILADTIAHMGQELTVPGDLRSRLIEMAKWLVESGLVSVKLLQERCEAEFLWEVDMIKIKAADLKSKEVRVNTRLLYQQTKFNLLREESEGYAKLVTVLSQRGPDGLTEYNAPFVISTIKSLIGHFDLDPNRVIDIVLECYELQPENKSFLELMPLFPKSHTCHILGFKFQYYQRLEVVEPVPIGLYILAATLIKEDFIDLDSIYAHLLPKDEDSFEQYEEFSKRRLDEANKIGKINLAATGKDLMEEEKPGDVTIDLYAPLDMESEAALEHSNEMLTNQKLGLLVGFLSVYDWPHAHLLFERLSPLNPIAHLQICNGLFRAIERAIAPSYAFVRPAYLAKLGSSSITGNLARTCEVETKHVSQPAPFVELGKEFFQMLSCAGPYLHRDALLLQKVCRVLRGYYASAQALATSQGPNISAIDIGEGEQKDPRFFLKEARARVEEALGACLLPSLQLLPANPAVGLEIWDVLSLLPYEVRYRLYGEWEKDDERIPIILAARQTAKLDTRRILKRLAKENLKQLGRMVAKISHANPMTVLRTIVHQIEAYKDMITPVVDAFKYLTQLEYDVLEYVVIERLAQGGREKVKEDGLNLSDWLQSLASFWGSLCKKYPSMELRGLFQYLVNQLKRGEGVELVVLQELIQQMANVEYTENMTEDQLEAMAGGETLRFQATSFGITRNNKALLKSTNRLRDTLLPRDEPKLAVPLLLLIAQQRSNVVITADAPYIKMVSEQFDRCHGTLLQYVEFLTSAVTPVTAYSQLIPSLDDLVHKYHTEPEVVFLVYRPVMRLFKPFKGATIGWPLDNTRQLSQSDESMEGSSSVATNDLILNLGAPRKTLMWSELLASIHSMLPPKAWNSLSPELYATFWGLTIHDLYVPRRRYEIEISKQQASLKSLEENTDNSHTAITKRKKDKEKIQEVLERLSAELLKQEQHVAAVHQRLLQEKDSWLTSCPDSLKINMEFLQRCIFPRCVVSMLDAIYCARFVHTLHSLGTPFFNTVNHIDVLICKTLQPMISSCTEYEAGRLGRFLYETLKMAYHWKSDEVVYERECGNMPGFAVLYRDPNSPRVTFVQFIRVHWKWSSRITKLLIQCLESSEYIEIRNALTVLTKISSVFPVTRKSGMNLEKRVSKIKGDEREDLKVLATGVSAALAARKSAWVTDEEFGMGYIDFKPAASPAKLAGPASSVPVTNIVSQADIKTSTHGIETASSDQEALISGAGTLPSDTGSGRLESAVQGAKSEPPRLVSKLSNANMSKDSHLTLAQVTALAQAEAAKSVSGAPKTTEGLSRTASGLQGTVGSDGAKQVTKSSSMDNENRATQRRLSTSISQASISKSVKQEAPKVDSRASSAVGRVPSSTLVSTVERECLNYVNESSRQRTSGTVLASVVTNGTASIPGTIKSTVGEKKGTPDSATKVRPSADLLVDAKLESSKTSDRKGSGDYEGDGCDSPDAAVAGQLHCKSPGREEATSAFKLGGDASKERIHKRSTIVEETEKLNKRRKADVSERSGEAGEVRGLEKEKVIEQRAPERPRSIEHEKPNHDDRSLEKIAERSSDRGKGERMDRDYRGADKPLERLDRIRGEDFAADRSRDRSLERFGRERSVDRVSERGSSFDRSGDRGREERLKDDRMRPRYELTSEQPHPDDRFPMQNLPPPPPLPPNMVPQSLPGARREEDDPHRTVRIASRASPHREEKVEKRRLDEGSISVVDDPKKRRDDDIRDRKRDDREIISMKADKEREREKEKAILLKDDEGAAALSKRRRLKRDHLSSSEIPANFGPSPPLPPPPPPPVPISQQYDRDRERKGNAIPRGMYMEDPTYDKGLSSRVHVKDASKIARRDHEQAYDREWDEEKRRGDIKRRHHRK